MAQQKYGNDFPIGSTFTTQAITVTETHLVNWAGLTMDYYPIHTDKEFAAKSSFGERLAHGPLIFGLAVGLASISNYGADAVIAWLGADKMRMTAPVKIGDTIKVTIEVLSHNETKDPAKGVQTWRYTVTNQREETVMHFDYTMMFHMRT
ncbi:MaoC domain protein dehydratase [Desulfatibacillum aliphaticivorans]|uniref:MaoC domain protein dehydratase n=1 Tax=Desulfatibacillum aliphaticivorans TaxID=218208 RepID=B8FLC8_DESAL|nr:MaoC/PaaZ C-terminal domain-containing protein [Desulfatibacillum aliphaticivorans]ACL05074.1 MaoC domain protein dehydratase [Desulfatibacillum aliphaticivorans]